MYLAVRRAKIEEAETIHEVTMSAFALYQTELHVNYEVKALTETVDSVKSDILNNTVYVAERNNKIVGSIRCRLLNNGLAYVYRFGVSPEISNSGLGSALLDAVVEDCKETGVKAIALHTNSKYYSLARYYYGKGFYVHSTSTALGYVRAMFVLELSDDASKLDLSPALAL